LIEKKRRERAVSSLKFVLSFLGFCFVWGLMEGRTTIAATVKGMEDVKAWFDKKEQQERSSRAVKEAFEEKAAISIRVSQATQQQQQELFTMFGRKSSDLAGVGDMGGDGEEYEDTGKTFCCFPSSRGRRYSRRKAGAYGMEEPQESPIDPNKGVKSLLALCSCCGSTRTSSRKWVVEVRGVGVVQEKELGSSAGRWEVDVNEDDYFKPAPMWKQLVRKMKAQARHVQAAGSRNESWLNYDPQSYQKNFDNGEFRQQTYHVRHSLDEENSDHQHAAKEMALHTALLQRIASTRSQHEATTQVVPKLPAAA
jgi:hypothetical protein